MKSLDEIRQENKNRIVISDLDGTISDAAHRLHFLYEEGESREPGLPREHRKKRDWDGFYAACVDDAPIHSTIAILQGLHMQGHPIWIFTGRSGATAEATEQWLKDNLVPCEMMLMRNVGDHTEDHRLKKKWLNELKPQLTGDQGIILALEDRTRVVNMWRENGIPCHQVCPGDF